MAWTVQLDPPSVATGRTMLDLHDAQGLIQVDQKGIDWGDAAIEAYMANEQRWGQTVVSYRVPNRRVSIPLFYGADINSSGEASRASIQHKVALFQREGGWLMRQRSGGVSMYADVVNATLTQPDAWLESGGVQPDVVLVLECLPDFYGDPITLDTITASGGEFSGVLTNGGQAAVILGDHPGRATITYIDGSAQTQYGVIWGFRARHYDPATKAKLIWHAAADMNTTGGSTVSALSGAYNGQAITQNAGSSFTNVGYLVGSHIGSYQVWARVYVAAATTWRLAWAYADTGHGYIYGPQVSTPAVAGFYLLNLGQVRLDPIPIGNQQWAGVFQAEAASAQSVSLDRVFLQPLDESSGQLEGSLGLDSVIPANGQMLLRWDTAVHSSVTFGTSYFTPVSQVLGDLPRLPPSGLENRPVQFLAKTSRSDLTGSSTDPGTDTFTASLSYRPSYLFRP